MSLEKLPISAFVVTRNESKYLKQCLQGIDYCDEIVVVDLHSTDDCVRIATDSGARVIIHDPVPFVEIIHEKIKDWANHKWLLITDPDEVADENLKAFVVREFETWSKDETLGSIRAPMTYYVGKRPIKGTGWGPTNQSRVYVVNSDRYEFTGDIHRGRRVKPGFRELFIQKESGVIHHYWVENISSLITKCRRYLKYEKESIQERKSFVELIRFPLVIFYSSFFFKKGYRDGLLGFVLSLVLSWYGTASYLRRKLPVTAK